MADTGTPSGIGWPDPGDGEELSDTGTDPRGMVGVGGRHSAPSRIEPVGWPDVSGRIELPVPADGQNEAAVVSRETFDEVPVSDPVPVAEDASADAGYGVGLTAAAQTGSPAPSYFPRAESPSDVPAALVESPPAPGEATVTPITVAPTVPVELPDEDSVDDLGPEPDDVNPDDTEPTEELPRLPLLGNPLPRPAQGRVLVVANQKGGVGKTTTAVNLAAALVAYGARVLVVDLDPQGNASTALGIPHQEEVEGVYEVLIGDCTMAEIVQETPGVPGLYGAPATIKLAGAEIELVSFVARESRLKRPLESYLAEVTEAGERFDYVLIDCPPSLGLLTLNALVAAKEVLIPIQCEYYALEGVSQLLRTIGLVQRELNQDLEVSTVILTMYDGRTRLAAGVADEVRSHFGDRVLRTAVPRSVRISEAPSYGQTVITHDPTSSGALSYLEAAREFALQ